MPEHPTRTKVLDAVDELAEHGIDRVTIDAISDASGVTNGSIYHHFGSRSGALAAAAARAFADSMGEAVPALDDRDAETCVRDFVDRYLTWVQHNPNRATVMYEAPLAVDLGDSRETKLHAFAPVLDWIRERSGQVRDVPPELLDPIVFGAVHESVRRWLAGDRRTPLSAVRSHLADAVWRLAQPD